MASFLMVRRTIIIASCSDRSVSSMNCSAPPRKTIVHVLAFTHPVNRLYLHPHTYKLNTTTNTTTSIILQLKQLQIPLQWSYYYSRLPCWTILHACYTDREQAVPSSTVPHIHTNRLLLQILIQLPMLSTTMEDNCNVGYCFQTPGKSYHLSLLA